MAFLYLFCIFLFFICSACLVELSQAARRPAAAVAQTIGGRSGGRAFPGETLCQVWEYYANVDQPVRVHDISGDISSASSSMPAHYP